MLQNLTGKQILIIIVLVIIVLWLISWFFGGSKTTTIQRQIPVIPQQQAPISNLSPQIQPFKQLNPNNQRILYFFTNPGCSACKNFQPTWDNLSSKSEFNDIYFKKIDVTRPEPADEHLVFYYNITKTPTIILKTPKSNTEYTGEHSLNNLSGWISNLNQ